MTSAIDVKVPIYGDPTTKSVRDNFVAAHDEIGALQTDVATKINRSGDTMTGFLSLYLDPELPTHAATKNYVDSKVGSGGGGGASLTVADTPPTIANGKMWFDSNKTQLYVGYDDGTSSQWVIANNPNVVTTGAINTALQPSYNNVGRNLIHNSMFNIQQRGSGAFTVGGYTSDRWWQWFVGGTLSTTIRATTDAERTAIGDESCRYCFQSSMVMGAPNQRLPGDYKGFSQAIEDVRKLAGKTVTVSFWATGSAGMKLGVSIDQQFGTGGSSAVVGVGQAVALTTTFKRYSLTFVVPSIVGKTVGTSNDKTDLHFWLSSSFAYSVQSGSVGEQSGTISVWGVQLEIGNVTTPLEKPDPQVDLANCKRFYQQADIYQSWSNGVAGHGTQTSCVLPYGMRSNPTLTIIDVSGNVNVSGFSLSCLSRQGNIIVYTGGGVTTSNASSYINVVFSASADL